MMAILVLLLLLPLLLAGILTILVRPYRPVVGWIGVGAASLSFGTSLWLWLRIASGSLPSALPTDVLQADPLSAVLLACVTFVSLISSALGPGLLPGQEIDARKVRRFRIYLNAFAVTMLLAVLTQNVALMWVAIEATTIASAVAIPLNRTKASVEASWKYMVICSVGIALAFAGTVLAYFDFVSTAGAISGALNWSVLRSAAPALHRELMQLAFAFILVGYGTKAGLAPMHTWLPDAHSEAPVPISAMMSAVLVAVSMYAILRWKIVVDATGAAAFTNNLLLGAGLLSAGIGAFSLVIQRHYKRMLAYSTVEHMGLVGIGLALGPLGIFASLLHLVNHACAKAMVFLLSGRIIERYQTSEISGVSGLLRAMPWTGGLFTAGILALVGLPPFGLFISEFLLVRAAILTGHPLVAAITVVLLLTAFISLVRHLNAMLYGEIPQGVAAGEEGHWHFWALGSCVAVLVTLGLVLPSGVSAVLQRSVEGLVR
jgi:hydrogenase-4 component F